MAEDEYPVKLETCSTMGRYLTASRNIAPGELVLTDTPIIMCPSGSSSKNGTTCLGCYGIVQTISNCSKCGWPVCNLECEEIPDHADFECKIFAKQNIKLPLPSPLCFIADSEYIKVLRCLLLKESEKDEQRWKLLKDLEAHVDLRKTIPKVLLMSKLIRMFIQDLCKLSQFDDDVIEFVLGAVDVNAFRNAALPVFQNHKPVLPAKPTNSTFIYHKGSLVAHSCRRNTQSLTYANGLLEMRAGDYISKDEPISHAYVDLMLGTLERRKLLKEQFYFDCVCQRCSDPTELGTYFSALKCQQCPEGYLLMDNPLEFCPYWKCDKCTDIQTTEYETDILKDYRSQENKLMKTIGETDETIQNLLLLHKKFSDVFHENHYVLLHSQVNLVKCASKLPAKLSMMEIMQKIVEKYKKLYNTFYPNIDTNVPAI